MYLSPFFNTDQQTILISAEQGSQFAKSVSSDFNPLHDPDSKRFCVPGDLLFALVLAQYGLSKSMHFNYTGMVGKDAQLDFPEHTETQFNLKDKAGKSYLEVTRQGDITHDMTFIEAFTRAYVAFSGLSFTDILVPLMQTHQVMINPERPMVIYDSMSFEFNSLDNIQTVSLKIANSTLEVTGKRGLVTIYFDIYSDETIIGKGNKTMLLSGLRAYEQAKIDLLIMQYKASKQKYLA